jgi:hypothetical protein
MATKYTKWQQIRYTKLSQNRPKGLIIDQHLTFQDPPKFSQIGMFGSKICHLATPDSNEKHWSYCIDDLSAYLLCIIVSNPWPGKQDRTIWGFFEKRNRPKLSYSDTYNLQSMCIVKVLLSIKKDIFRCAIFLTLVWTFFPKMSWIRCFFENECRDTFSA